jgi:hypothetical protein
MTPALLRRKNQVFQKKIHAKAAGAMGGVGGLKQISKIKMILKITLKSRYSFPVLTGEKPGTYGTMLQSDPGPD